jgi:hypothetical protein
MVKNIIKSITLFTFPFMFLSSVYSEEPQIHRKYWDNGNVRFEAHVHNGKLEGLVTSWYESGAKESVGNFKNGKLEGLLMSGLSLVLRKRKFLTRMGN